VSENEAIPEYLLNRYEIALHEKAAWQSQVMIDGKCEKWSDFA